MANSLTRICVTGATGKAGRAAVRELREHGYDVLATDAAVSDARAEGVLKADLTDYGQATEVLRGSDAVVHLANNADGSLTLTPAYDLCPQPRSVPQANQAMAIGRAGERSSQLSTCLAACEVYLLTTAQAKDIIDAQVEVIQTQWSDAADAAQLTELDRLQLFVREILNEFAFRH